MKFPTSRTWRALAAAGALVVASLAGSTEAHEISAGELQIVHPYATPSLAGVPTGAAYFTALENKGTVADKLVRASTPAAASVEMHSMAVDAQGVMRMREVAGIPVAPKEAVKMKPGMGYHLMLVGLKRPLKEGESFTMTLQFERAGKVEITVMVQAPHTSADMPDMHVH